MADDLNGKTMLLIFRGSGLCLHATTLPHSLGAQQVADARSAYWAKKAGGVFPVGDLSTVTVADYPILLVFLLLSPVFLADFSSRDWR